MGVCNLLHGKEQACVAWAALREGGCTPGNGATLHLWWLKKADSPLPSVVNLQIECKTALAGSCAAAGALQGERKRTGGPWGWLGLWIWKSQAPGAGEVCW